MPYATPIQEMQFALGHVAGFDELQGSDAYEDLSDDLVSAIVEEAGKLCDNVLAPLNWQSDRNGAKLENGVVTTTPGFKEAYQECVDGGWMSLALPKKIGGQGLPTSLYALFLESVCAGCVSFSFCPISNFGAIKAIDSVATDEQRRLYMPKLVSGEWMTTMNLTEPQSGSDLSELRTKAEPVGDGRYKISGQKIYITYGDHDLTENIIHLVLARLPDAPEGTAGISMFLVSKHHVNDDGSLGARNDATCVSLEEKLGIHGSPTCVMAYGENGECYGTLLGEENKGLRNMFVMMNSARVDVGLQGVGVAERSFQHALEYAQERRQGRAPGVRTGPMATIYEHNDVRRMLYTMKALIEASRAICYTCAVAGDIAKTSPSADRRLEAARLEGLLTPIAKAWSTDRASEVTSFGVQVHGGMGFIEETGAAQYMRDARIFSIYEGTNGIQAIDLVTRKLLGDKGEAMSKFIAEARALGLTAEQSGHDAVKAAASRLKSAIDALSESTAWLLRTGKESPDDVLAGATPYLKQFGNVAGGFYLIKGALTAVDMLSDQDADHGFLETRILIADFYAQNFLSEAEYMTAAVTAGATRLKPVAPEKFSQ
ncbi:MAG: acyl-CoA dehydrogenase [Pseudomonadota bacterium]